MYAYANATVTRAITSIANDWKTPLKYLLWHYYAYSSVVLK